jgi:hypothetical protein
MVSLTVYRSEADWYATIAEGAQKQRQARDHDENRGCRVA